MSEYFKEGYGKGIPEIGWYNYQGGLFIIITGVDDSDELKITYILGSKKLS